MALALAAMLLLGFIFLLARLPTPSPAPCPVEKPVIVRWRSQGLIHPLDRLRVATYNIQDFVDGVQDGTNRSPEKARRHAALAARIISRIDPDILLLQEVENAAALRLLLDALPQPYPLAAVTDFAGQSGRPLNIAVVSRVPLYHLRELDFGRLPGSDRPPRGALSFVVRLGTRRNLLVYAVHLKSNFGDPPRNRSKRYRALRLVRADATAFQQRFIAVHWEIMIAGDMNVDPDNARFAGDFSLRPIADWTDLWRGVPLTRRITVPTRRGEPSLEFPPATFDRFVVSPELTTPPWTAAVPRVLATGVDTGNVFAVGGEGSHVSDHYPVYVDLYL